jgi:hypothetical protein
MVQVFAIHSNCIETHVKYESGMTSDEWRQLQGTVLDCNLSSLILTNATALKNQCTGKLTFANKWSQTIRIVKCRNLRSFHS